jgi:regulator of protease activity HflC (stomatin/prohibitin superfamily)
MKKINVAQGLIALTSKNGDFKQLLVAGEHRVQDWFNKLTVSFFTLNNEPIEEKLANHLRQFHMNWVNEYCVDINLSDDEVAFLYLHHHLVEIIAPQTRRLYWKTNDDLRIEKHNVTQLAMTNELTEHVVHKKGVKGRDLCVMVQIFAGQIGLLKVDGEIKSLLEAGNYGFWSVKQKPEIQVIDVCSQSIDKPIDAVLAEQIRQYHPNWVASYGVDIDLSDDEIGFLYSHNNLVEILSPATRRLYWKSGNTLRVEKQKVGHLVLPEALTQRLAAKKRIKGSELCLVAQIPAWHIGVLKIDGEITGLLEAGTHGYWRVEHTPEIDIIDTRLQSLEVSGQEILTKDKVTLRINLSANWRYADVLHAFSQLSQPVEHLYRELQFSLREIVGTRTLDELLENKQLIDELMLTQVVQSIAEFGLEVDSIGVKDIILPGEMRTILSQVVEAEKSAQANVIRRREETAATRSLLNTAKVMENNPVALRLKELETLESIAHRIDQISVYGGLDQVLNGLVKIKE